MNEPPWEKRSTQRQSRHTGDLVVTAAPGECSCPPCSSQGTLLPAHQPLTPALWPFTDMVEPGLCLPDKLLGLSFQSRRATEYRDIYKQQGFKVLGAQHTLK